jgi:hypothetical protein
MFHERVFLSPCLDQYTAVRNKVLKERLALSWLSLPGNVYKWLGFERKRFAKCAFKFSWLCTLQRGSLSTKLRSVSSLAVPSPSTSVRCKKQNLKDKSLSRPAFNVLRLTSNLLRLTSYVSLLTSHFLRLTSYVSLLTSHFLRLT